LPQVPQFAASLASAMQALPQAVVPPLQLSEQVLALHTSPGAQT